MQNYKFIEKIIKTKPVTYYYSTHKQSQQNYIVKKLNKPTTWQQLLQSKTFSIIKHTKCKYFAKIKQVIKDQNNFYSIMQSSDLNMTKIIANEIQRKDIYKISKQLIELIVELKKENIIIRDIRPSHIFFNQHKTNLKIYHFETFAEKDFSELDLTEIQDMRYISPEQVLTRKGSNQKCSIFSIALIICELIMGEPLIKAKNKLEYIYQLTQLFPNDRIDKMKGSQHEFKQLPTGQSFTQKIQKQDISNAFIALLIQMLKIDHTQRVKMEQILQRFNQINEEEENFQKNKAQSMLEASISIKPNRNQVNLNNYERNLQIDFDFENKPTLSILPHIFSQRVKGSRALPKQQNVQDDGNQPIIIKQSSFSQKNLRKMTEKDIKNQKQLQYLNPSIHQNSNYQLTGGRNLNPNKLLPLKYNQLKNSRSTKQTLSTTIKKPQLTNYALNEANLGIKLGMNATLFSENQNDF